MVGCELAGLGKCAEIDSDLREWNYGAYEGLTPQQIRAEQPTWMIFADGCPGGDTAEQVGTRADRVIARVRDAKADAALFAHGHVLRVLVARWLGLPAAGGSHCGENRQGGHGGLRGAIAVPLSDQAPDYQLIAGAFLIY